MIFGGVHPATKRAARVGVGQVLPEKSRQGRIRAISTPARLRRLRTMILTAAALSFAAAIVLTAARHETVASVRDQTFPAVLGALEAHAALSDADRAVWGSFRSGEAQLIGPGQDYQDDIAIAGLALAQLAGLQGSEGAIGRRLQTVNGLLVNYQGLVGQAAATYRSAAAKELGYAYLSYASKSLRDPEGGLLAAIDAVAAADRRSLAARDAASWTNPWLLLAYAAFALALLASLLYTLRFLRRGFRRRISPPLALATALATGISLWLCVTTLRSDRAFSRAHDIALPQLTAIWHSQTRSVDRQAKELQAGGASQKSAATRSAPPGRLDVAATQTARDDLDSTLATAADTRGLPIALPLAASAIGALTFFGLRRRLDEYRA